MQNYTSRYPMLFIVIAFVAGLSCSSALSDYHTTFWILTPTFALLAIISYWWLPRAGVIISLLAVMAAGGTVGTALHKKEQLIAEHFPAPQPVRIDARVIDIPLPTNKRTTSTRQGGYILEFFQNVKMRAIVYFTEQPDILPGDNITIIGRASLPRQKAMPNMYDRRENLAKSGIYLQISSASVVSVNSTSRYSPSAIAAKLRRYGAETFRENLHPRYAEIFIALVLGYRYGVDPNDRAIFSESGLGHLFAVSGLHVAILAYMITVLLSQFGIREKKRAVILGVLITFYALVVGARPPVIRATVMILTYLGATLIGRGRDTINTISFSAFVLLLFSPSWYSSPGFLLSFAAVGSIVMLFPVFEELWAEYYKIDIRLEMNFERSYGRMAKDWLRRAVFVSLAAQIGVQPLLIHFMGFFNPWGVFANVFVLPLAAVVLGAGIASMLLTPLSALLAPIAALFLELLLIIATTLSMLPSSLIYTQGTQSLTLIIFYAILLFLLLRAHSRIRDIWDEAPEPLNKKSLGIGAGVCVLVLVVGALASSFKATPITNNSLAIFEFGKHHASVIKTSSGKQLLFGTGTPGSGKFLISKLHALGIKKLDTVIIPEDSAKYTTGLPDVLKTKKPHKLLLPNTKIYSENIINAKYLAEDLSVNLAQTDESFVLYDNDFNVGFVDISLNRAKALNTSLDILVILQPKRTFNLPQSNIKEAASNLNGIISKTQPKIVVFCADSFTQNTTWGEVLLAELNKLPVKIIAPIAGTAVVIQKQNNKLLVKIPKGNNWILAD